MDISKVKIVVDSSCDLKELSDVAFSSAPLKINTKERSFLDNTELDTRDMVEYLSSYSGKSSTSCPNPNDFLDAFGDAEFVFCITITATLSGSYNSAVRARDLYALSHPERRVYVLNSLSTGPEMQLIVEHARELILEGLDFRSVCEELDLYSERCGLLFMLESMKNLANNGRVSPIVAKLAGFLGIRLVGKASDKGDLEPLEKPRGEKKAIASMFENMKKLGYVGGRVRISHCYNEKARDELIALIKKNYPEADVTSLPCRGLCSFYAERGGMLVGFEKQI